MNQKLSRLAVFGAAPSFREKLHVGRPNVGDRERLFARIGEILERRWLSNYGPCVQELEQRLAEFLGVKHCIAMCNATIGLEIVIRALELTGEVILPSFTFIATAHALQWLKVTPVFCDIDPATHNLDPKRVAQAITPRTSGIIGVHLWGRPCDVAALSEIAGEHGLKLIFDAAHAFGCSYRGTTIGSFGDAEVFSFHATKFFNSFEGGAVATNNDELAKKIRLMMNFGFAGYDHVVQVGTNGKMNEVSAAMGLENFASLDQFVTTNRRNYEQYQQEVAHIPGLTLLTFDENERNNYQYVVVEVDEATTQVTRDQLVEILWAENVLARRYFYPGCHRMEPYRSLFPNAGAALPETEKLTQRVLVLPTGTAVNTDDIVKLCGILENVVRNGSEIRRTLEQRLAVSGVIE
ncbi:MAG TPA: aminotransferase class I/II-fold pyridoxal phosphate-dependent enzyme [Pyrinomonadaceae bacterium]|nr:aminotransferase class I/II-fold pyridoxal phosphate-dependent enzyme [Pyrinomonadaceae bacterium]